MAQTLNISTRHEHDVCDVCARTLLRGEQTEAFIGGGRRYTVCELCKPHAFQEGWQREGTIPEFQGAPDRERRRSIFSRLRGKGPRDEEGRQPSAPRHLDDELSLGDWTRHLPPVDESAAQARAAGEPPSRTPGPDRGGAVSRGGEARGAQARRGESRGAQSRGGESRGAQSRGGESRGAQSRGGAQARAGEARGAQREPRHVHAIPSSIDHKIAAALDSFNATGHTRTISGVARSLGAPLVSLYPDASYPSTIWIVVAWELCWYRYEVDLSESSGNVRLDSQGYELSELQDHERSGHAGADDTGTLFLF